MSFPIRILTAVQTVQFHFLLRTTPPLEQVGLVSLGLKQFCAHGFKLVDLLKFLHFPGLGDDFLVLLSTLYLSLCVLQFFQHFMQNLLPILHFLRVVGVCDHLGVVVLHDGRISVDFENLKVSQFAQVRHCYFIDLVEVAIAQVGFVQK